MAESSHVLVADELRVVLDPSGVDIADQVTLWVDRGEVLGLVGESGSGKTTIATALMAHERRGAKVASGSVVIEGQSVLSMDPGELRQARGGLISYVPQDPSMSLNPALRIRTQLLEILEWHSFGGITAERQARVAEMLAEVMLPTDSAFLRRYPHQLSGGQQQRVAIAMAFACRPAMIVLDEPTTGLDVSTQAHVLETVRELAHNHGVAALYVTHDLAVVANLADRIAVMYGGRLVEFCRTQELLSSAAHPYTRRLLAAVPDLTGDHRPRGIPGVAPVPGRRPEGCSFGPRCDEFTETCLDSFPPDDGPSEDHRVRCWHWREVGTKPVAAELERSHRQTRTLKRDEAALSVVGVNAFHGSHQILHAVDVSVRAGRCLALVGESGSGKTTLARCIAGIHPGRIDGEMLLNGRALDRNSRRRSKDELRAIQYVFQSPYGSLNPRKSVERDPCLTAVSLAQSEAKRVGGAHDRSARTSVA